MRVGFAAPLHLQPLKPWLDDPAELPAGIGPSLLVSQITSLLKAGVAVDVFTLDQSVTEPVTLGKGPLRVFVGPYRPRHRMRDLMRQECAIVARAVDAAQPDMVHAHWLYEFALGAMAGLGPERVLVTVHDWAANILRYSPDLYRVGRWVMFQIALRRARHLAAVSPVIAGHIERALGHAVPSIPVGIDDELILPEPRRFRGHAPTILGVNNGFGRRKNVGGLMRAFALLRREMPGARLILVGDNFEAGGIAGRWAQDQGLAANIDFRGPVPLREVLRLMDEADLFAHAALEESMLQSAVEAQARGLPVVAGWNAEGPAWVLDEGRAGHLVDTRLPEQMAAAMLNMLSDAAMWEGYSASGLRLARERFAASAVLKHHVAEYQRILG